jgi:hypothetical protein
MADLIDKLFPTDKYRGTSGLSGPTTGSFGTNLTFSGCDIIPVVPFEVRNETTNKYETKLFVIGDIATLTYSIHQDKGAVRTLGRAGPRGFVRGPETIAGTMIFNVLEKQALFKMANERRNIMSGKTQPLNTLPMFDIILYFANEAGHEASLGIFGIQVLDEGQSHSVEDTYVETTAQYVALSVQPLEPISARTIVPGDAKFIAEGQDAAKTGFVGRHRDADGKVIGLPFDYSYLKPST